MSLRTIAIIIFILILSIYLILIGPIWDAGYEGLSVFFTLITFWALYAICYVYKHSNC